MIILISCLNCKTYNSNTCDILKVAVNSEEFNNFFNLCKKEENNIHIYDATGKFTTCNSFDSNCNKKIVVKEKDFNYDVNKIEKKREDKGLILYEFFNTKSKCTLSFLDTKTNSILKLTLKNNKVVDVNGGSF